MEFSPLRTSATTPSVFLPHLVTAVAFAIAVIYYAARSCRRCALPSLPGPVGLPIVGNLLFLHPELHTFFTRLAATYGPLFRLRLGSKIAVVVSSSDIAREILRDQDSVFANRDVPAAARVIAYGGNSDIVWNANGPTWRMLRRVCVSQMLSTVSLDAVYYLRRRELRAAIRHLHSAAVAGDPVDVGAEMFLVVLNVITGMLWGGTVEAEEERSAVGKEFRELVGEITELLGRQNISDFFPSMARFDLQGVERKMRVMLEKFDGIFAKIIEKRRGARDGNCEENKDFLEYMLRVEEEGSEKKTPFTMTHVKALLMDMIVGGTETSSNTLEFAMAEMLNKPETIQRAQEELNQVVGKDSMVEESHLSKLHYLKMVIKEVLRLHPVLPLLVPHCPSSTCVVGGYAVPEGSRVFINVWAIHRDPAVWKEPLEFRPERFMETEGRWDFTGGDFGYLPFGSGRRRCAGITMAERMVAYSLASLLHSFDWKIPTGAKLDLSEKFGIVLKKAKPLVAVPIPRLSPKLYA